MRRLSDTQEGYLSNLECFHKSCLLFGLNNEMVERIIFSAKTWTEHFPLLANQKKKQQQRNNASKKTLVWATPFTNLIKLDKREKQFAPLASITYKKPSTLGTILANYKHIAH